MNWWYKAVAIGALAAVFVAVPAPAARADAAPARLAIYYGYPSLINGASGNLDRAVAALADYDVLVLGDGLAEAGSLSAGTRPHPDRSFAMRLIPRLKASAPSQLVFGYIDLGNSQRLPMSEIIRRIAGWSQLGVDGIFFDEAGFDYGVTRERQNEAISAVHARGMRAFVNAFVPDDVFGTARVPLNAVGGGNPTGVAPVVGRQDLYLLESFAIRNGRADAPQVIEARTRSALDGRRRFGTRICAVALGDESAGTNSDHLSVYAWFMAALFGLDAYGWSTPNYGAVSSRMVPTVRPNAEAVLRAAEYLDEPQLTAPIWRRRTTAGTITLDTVVRNAMLSSR